MSMSATVSLAPSGGRLSSSLHPDRAGDTQGYRAGCRCKSCSRAWKSYLRELADRSYEPLDAVDHVLWLMDCGISKATIAKWSGVSVNTVGGIARGRITQVRFHVAQRLFAVTPRLVGTPVGASRRLRGLVATGWPITELLRRSQLSSAVVYRVLAGSMVNTATVEAISELWTSLWRDDPISSGVSPEASAQAREYARLRGWVPVLAWPEAELELPTATPIGVRSNKTSVSWAELVAELTDLADFGCGFTEAASRTGYGNKPRSLEKRLVRSGAEDLLEDLRRNDLRHELRDAA